MSDYRIIPTVRKHIVPNNALPCGRIPIRIDKPAPRRIIIPALQIVQPRFRVVDVPAVAQRVLCAEGARQRACGAQRVAPCVVAVGHNARAAGADKAGHVALRVLDVEILRLTLDVAAVIVGIRPRLPCRLIVLAHELVEAVVGIGRRALAVGDEELQWYGATHHPILLQIPQLTSSAATAAVP